MYQRFVSFISGLSTTTIGSLGVGLTTSAFVMFVIVELLRLMGIVTSSYVGLITYLALPALFILGLILIPIGWSRLRKSTGQTTQELLSRNFTPDALRGDLLGSRLLRMFLLFTVINIVFLGGGTARMLHFMEEPEFCGTACHSVMSPEWATYQQSPHSNVKCVECHVGEGVDALIDSKLNGLWQMVSVTFDLYERPIPTPVHQLRPARETCEKCHWPDKFYGDRLLKKTRYRMDEANTPAYTTLSLKIGSGQGDKRGEIHWHIAERNEVRYASVDDEREEIIWVEALQPDGSWHRYENRNLTGVTAPEESHRSMDCVDCHNRATHIYEDPEQAIDDRMAAGLIDRSLPFIKARALAALTAGYPDKDAAMPGIERSIAGFYRQSYPEQMGMYFEKIDQAVATVQDVYRRNIHHRMNVQWGAYPSHLGHRNNGGCFRCHNEDMVDAEGRRVSNDCTLCHSILSFDSDHPFQYLLPGQEKGDPDYKMHMDLQKEFLRALD
jgi:NapC/NirT cytochrome c family, N-terminal region